jgi:hypothetical protein
VGFVSLQTGETYFVPEQVEMPQLGVEPGLQTPASQVSLPSHFVPLPQLVPVGAGFVVHLPLTQSRTRHTLPGMSQSDGVEHGLHAAVGV